MRKAAAALFLVVLILLASCNSTAHDGSEGKSIEITLPENPSTGYSWIWGQMGAGHIELLSDTVIPGDGIGAPGEHVFTFVSTKPGHVTLTFSSRQMWEGGAIGETEAFSVTVYDDMTMSYL